MNMQENKQQQHQQNLSYHDDNYNIATQPGVFVDNAAKLEQIREAYVDNIGTLTGAAASLIEKALQCGLSFDDVILAIEETGLAPRPSARYLQKILETWAESGVTVSRLRHEMMQNRATKWWK